MTKILSSSLILAALCAASPAFAGGVKGSFGIGADVPLGGTTGATPEVSADYDGGIFNVGGGLGVLDPDGPNNTEIDVSAHAYYHIASSAMADFGIGGNLLFQSIGDGMAGGGTNTNFFIEPAFQVRAFLASNVALVLSAGFSIGVGDSKAFYLGGGAVGDAGFRYYF